MHRRLLCLVLSAVALFFLATTYHLAGEKLTRLAGPSFSHPKANAPVPNSSPKENPTKPSDAKHTVESSEPESKKEKPAEKTEKPAKEGQSRDVAFPRGRCGPSPTSDGTIC